MSANVTLAITLVLPTNDRQSIEICKKQIHLFLDSLLTTCEKNSPHVDGQQEVSVPDVVTSPLSPEQYVDHWFARLGTGSRRFWRLVALHFQIHETLTFEDLATTSGDVKEKLRSNHRNSHRAILDVSAPDPMTKVWDAITKRYEYKMSPEIRDRILELSSGIVI
jgi:hypothetical protein